MRGGHSDDSCDHLGDVVFWFVETGLDEREGEGGDDAAHAVAEQEDLGGLGSESRGRRGIGLIVEGEDVADGVGDVVGLIVNRACVKG